MIKLAMINIHDAFKKKNFKSKMLLQVHDELVFDVLKSEMDLVKPVILECMQNALQLPNHVPTDAEIGSGDNWLAAH
jgi:DNA polymerase-1